MRPAGPIHPFKRLLDLNPLVVCSLFFLILGPGLGQTRVPNQELPDALSQGLELARTMHFAKAFEAFQRHITDHPEDPRGYYFSGMALRSDKRQAEAAVQLKRALELAPDQADYRFALALTLSELNQLDQALEVLKPFSGSALQAIQDPSVLWLLADVQFRREALDEALVTYRRYREVQPGDVRAILRQGQIGLLKGDWEAAGKAFQAAIDLSPETAAAHHGRGLALARSGRTDEARAAMGKAVELDSDASDFRLDLGKLLIDSGAPSQALLHLKKVAESTEPPAAVHFELARAYRRLGKIEESNRQVAAFRRARAATDEDRHRLDQSGAALRRGQELLKAGSATEARQVFAEAVRLDPDNYAAHSYLAKIYLSSYRPNPARSHLFKMRELNPESAELNHLLATYYYLVGDEVNALASAEKSRSQRPDYAETRNLLGNIYLALGRREEAIQEYREAVRLAPKRPDFRLNLEVASKKK